MVNVKILKVPCINIRLLEGALGQLRRPLFSWEKIFLKDKTVEYSALEFPVWDLGARSPLDSRPWLHGLYSKGEDRFACYQSVKALLRYYPVSISSIPGGGV